MDVAEFDYELPAELVAQFPPPARGESRLLVLQRSSGVLRHESFRALPELLEPGDLLVVNDTKVFPARLVGRRVPSGGRVECLLIGRLDEARWEALVHPGQKLKPGAKVAFTGAGGPTPRLWGEILERRFYGRRVVRLWTEGSEPVDSVVDEIGHVPLPPYIRRPDEVLDRERYQTVFARTRGSVAAPTAGLHFTGEMLQALDRRGVERAAVTLHVGYGTFKPVRATRVEDHTVDAEWFEISEQTATRVNRALSEGRRIVAVGTTTTRALESAAGEDPPRVVAVRRTTDLFIYPGYRFRIVGGLLTNFHLPRSSLLMLVAAFAGRERVLAAYREAVRERYRFYSYGDAMLIV